jgi:hypothetical protein
LEMRQEVTGPAFSLKESQEYRGVEALHRIGVPPVRSARSATRSDLTPIVPQ